MARCGCTAGGCSCTINDLDTDCINVSVSGSGTTDLPYLISAVPTLDPDPSNLLECGPAGLFVPTPEPPEPSLCAQKNVYTVATPSHALFAGLGAGTPEPFLSCADFVGDGLDDGVAIQEAIDAAVAGGTAVRSYPVVELLAGVFIAGGTSIDPKSVHLRGAGPEATSIMTIGGGQRIFDSDTGTGGSGKGGKFEDFLVLNTGGTTFYFPDVLGENTYFRRLNISGAVGESGDPASDIYQPIGGLYMESCWIGNGDTIAVPTVLSGALCSIMNNTFYSSSLHLEGSHSCRVQGNHFSDLTVAPAIPAIALAGNGWRNIISGNMIQNVRGHGISVDGTGGGQFDNTIANNLIYRYDYSGLGLYDGIHLRDGASFSNVQGNTIREPNLDANFGINVATADCSTNLVTNNDMSNCGFNDAGTLTAVTAGNRL